MFVFNKIKRICPALDRTYAEKWNGIMVKIAQRHAIHGIIRYGKVVTKVDLDRHFT